MVMEWLELPCQLALWFTIDWPIGHLNIIQYLNIVNNCTCKL